MVHNSQLVAAQSLEQCHLITHWGARLSTYLQYALGQRDQAMGRATKMYLAAARKVCQGWQQHHAHAVFTAKENFFMEHAAAAHHRATHTHGWAVPSLLDATPPPVEVGRRPLGGGAFLGGGASRRGGLL